MSSEKNNTLKIFDGDKTALSSLINRLEDTKYERVLDAVKQIARITESEEQTEELCKQGVIPRLINLLFFEDVDEDSNGELVVLNAAISLAHIARFSQTHEILTDEGTIPPLVRLMRSKNCDKALSDAVLTALRNLAVNPKYKATILRLGIDKVYLEKKKQSGKQSFRLVMKKRRKNINTKGNDYESDGYKKIGYNENSDSVDDVEVDADKKRNWRKSMPIIITQDSRSKRSSSMNKGTMKSMKSAPLIDDPKVILNDFGPKLVKTPTMVKSKSSENVSLHSVKSKKPIKQISLKNVDSVKVKRKDEVSTPKILSPTTLKASSPEAITTPYIKPTTTKVRSHSRSKSNSGNAQIVIECKNSPTESKDTLSSSGNKKEISIKKIPSGNRENIDLTVSKNEDKSKLKIETALLSNSAQPIKKDLNKSEKRKSRNEKEVLRRSGRESQIKRKKRCEKIQIKCVWNSDKRYIAVPNDITVDILLEVVKEEYKQKFDILKFQDSDNDYITITKTSDLELCFSQNPIILHLFGEKDIAQTNSEKRNQSEPPSNKSWAEEAWKDYPWLIPYEHLDLKDAPCLGRGFFGEVKLGKWRGGFVACKVIYRESFKDKTDEEMFIREVNVLSKLRHPQVILFMGACVDNGRNKVIVTEYMSKGSLYEFMSKNPDHQSEEILISIAKDIVLGMNYLHGENILHRDLNCRNILINEYLKAKVADFGLSRSKPLDSGVSDTMGAVAYMAPEIILNPSQFSTKADVYSMGIVMWEMWSKQNPIPDGMTPLQMARKIERDNYRPPLPVNLPPDWKDIIIKCWNRDPRMRPTFYEILEKVIEMEKDHHDLFGSPQKVTTSSNKGKEKQIKEEQEDEQEDQVDDDDYVDEE